jgi:ABC-type sugar transport system ATPase subunit
LEIHPGEILGLIGENGAGKSTLIKLLSGVHTPDRGTVFWQGCPVRFNSPHHALSTGIATIHQELAGFDRLSVSENMLLGETWPRYWWGGIDWPHVHGQAQSRLANFELNISPCWLFHELSSAQKQEVAIARALGQQARLLVLDEPTASLTEAEAQRLFSHLSRLRAEGVAILYVSHRLEEILRLADRVAVLRDGRLVAIYPKDEATVERMVHDMVGRPLGQIYARTHCGRFGETLLEVRNASRVPMFENISFSIQAGEIVGLAGLVGAGRSELGRALFGLYPIDHGEMRLLGQPWSPRDPNEAIRAGLVYLPEERKRQGLVLEHSVGTSISIGFSDQLARWGLIPGRLQEERIHRAMGSLGVRAQTPRQAVGTLSGGNQQKTLLARWLERGPQVVILDEPTRGVDIGAKVEIHKLIDQLAGSGKAVLLISSDLPEVLGMSDRVFVMHQGKISAELRGETMTQPNVILAASGPWRPGPEGS